MRGRAMAVAMCGCSDCNGPWWRGPSLTATARCGCRRRRRAADVQARRAWRRQCGGSGGDGQMVVRPALCAVRHRGGVGGCSGCATSSPWWRGRRRPARFLRLQRHGGEADVGRVGNTSLSQFGGSDNEGILRFSCDLGLPALSAGSAGKATAASTGRPLSRMGMRHHGESSAHSLGR